MGRIGCCKCESRGSGSLHSEGALLKTRAAATSSPTDGLVLGWRARAASMTGNGRRAMGDGRWGEAHEMEEWGRIEAEADALW